MSDAYTTAVIRDLQRDHDSQQHIVTQLRIENDMLKQQVQILTDKLQVTRRYPPEKDND